MSQLKQRGIRVGVVGVGYWGSKHVRVLRSTPGVTSVFAVDPMLKVAGRDGLADTAFGNLEEAIPNVDAVVIATPPSTHAELGLAAIAAGKHVLIEKPLATSVQQARQLVDAARLAGVVLMPGHTFQHNAAVHHLRNLVVSGELGDLYYLDCARLNLGLYQSDVNVITDLAPHDISIANFVLGSQPTTVTAWGSRHVHPDFEDVAYLRLDYEDRGVRANVHVSWLDPSKVRRITAVGSLKMAVYNDMAADGRIRVYDKAVRPAVGGAGPLSGVAYHEGGMQAPYVAFSEPLAVQDQNFVTSILEGTSPAVDGESGLAVVAVLECAQRSLREQRPVRLAEIDLGTADPRAVAAPVLAGRSQVLAVADNA